MQPTRRTWTAGGLGATLTALSPIIASPIPVVGAALLFGWLVARQVVATKRFRTTVDATTVSVEPSLSTVEAGGEGGELPVTLTVERPRPAAETELTVSLSTPPAADYRSGPRQVTLGVGETSAQTTVVFSMPVTGRITFPEPTWELRDTHAAFSESFQRGPTPTVTVSAPTLRKLHVGRGGTELSAFGEHLSDQTGDGVTPAELRQYLDGDPADRIDWKATARLREPFVREFEAENDREITLVVDHRARMAVGPPANSMLALLREVALGVVDHAEAVADPLGLVTVGRDGLTTTMQPTRRADGYGRIREQLLELEPVGDSDPDSSVEHDQPTAARRLDRELADEESTFVTTLRQFTDSTTAYVERFETDPLYSAVDYLHAAPTDSQLTVILTTDRDRPQLRETVRRAAANGRSVLVFLTPQALFETGALSDIERAYNQYREFEAFRTELEALGSVVAYEVGPDDRLAALLERHSAGTVARQTPRRN
jgi:uncharacterized protein (DUF58 family)